MKMGNGESRCPFFCLKLKSRKEIQTGNGNLETLLLSIGEVELTVAPFVLKSFLPFGFLLVFFLTFDT
jgi:hypothetical protein